MKILGIDDLSVDQLNQELERGGRFIIYQFCISAILMTFRQSSEIIFVKANESAITKGLPYSGLSFFLGWWGFPWGPLYTIGSFITNFRGGQDVTSEVVTALSNPDS